MREETFTDFTCPKKGEIKSFGKPYKTQHQNTIDVKTSELFKTGKVLVRYNELHDRLIHWKEQKYPQILQAQKRKYDPISLTLKKGQGKFSFFIPLQKVS